MNLIGALDRERAWNSFTMSEFPSVDAVLDHADEHDQAEDPNDDSDDSLGRIAHSSILPEARSSRDRQRWAASTLKGGRVTPAAMGQAKSRLLPRGFRVVR